MTTRELLNKIKGRDWYDYADQAMDKIREYDCENGTFGIVDDELLDEIVEREAREYGWTRVACLLNNAEIHSLYGCYIDAYGNAQTIHRENIEMWLEEIIENEGEE